MTFIGEGLTATFSQSDLPEAAAFLRLGRVLDAVSLCAETAADGRVEGVCGDTPYSLSYSPETGELRELLLPKENISVVFSDFCPDLG